MSWILVGVGSFLVGVGLRWLYDENYDGFPVLVLGVGLVVIGW